MNNECKHRDRLMYAIENMNENKNEFFEALENFRKYGSETKMNLQTASSTQIGGTHYINKKNTAVGCYVSMVILRRI